MLSLRGTAVRRTRYGFLCPDSVKFITFETSITLKSMCTLNKILRTTLVFVLFLVLGGCYENKLKVEQPPAEEVEFIAPMGKKIANSLVSTLKGEVKAAMESGGVEKAISTCYVKALPLTDSVAKSSSFRVSIKRISDKLRNPRNMPDEQEKLALALFNQIIRSGEELPEFYIQKITGGSTVEYNFYKPMRMESMCLICHGDKQTMAPNAAKLLAKYYPEDQARGYKEGDFRGLIRIKFYEPSL